jgi:hypothetical protein
MESVLVHPALQLSSSSFFLKKGNSKALAKYVEAKRKRSALMLKPRWAYE